MKKKKFIDQFKFILSYDECLQERRLQKSKQFFSVITTFILTNQLLLKLIIIYENNKLKDNDLKLKICVLFNRLKDGLSVKKLRDIYFNFFKL